MAHESPLGVMFHSEMESRIYQPSYKFELKAFFRHGVTKTLHFKKDPVIFSKNSFLQNYVSET